MLAFVGFPREYSTGTDQHIVQIFSSGNWVTSDIIVSASTEWDNNQETLRKTIIRLQTVTEIFIRENFGIRNGVRTRFKLVSRRSLKYYKVTMPSLQII